MQIFDFATAPDKIFEKSVVAIGVFDGVHLAHRELLAVAKRRAEARALPLAVFTFRAEVPTAKPSLSLFGSEDKARLLSACGVDAVLFASFPEVAGLSPDAFVSRVLVGTLGCALAVCGYNFRFGAGAVGTPELLAELMTKAGGESLAVPPYLFEGEPLSATRIRAFLAEGDLARANAALGAPYFYRARVAHGLRIGTKIGVPTLNLPQNPALLCPKHGVYAARCTLAGVDYPALVNLGVCPTFGEREAHFEVHLLTPVADAYGEEVTVTFLRYLRPERTFASPEELKAQIAKDIEVAR